MGLGLRLSVMAISYIATAWGGLRIMISARGYLVDFYSGLGFHVVSDDYLDGGIPHYKMLMQSGHIADAEDIF